MTNAYDAINSGDSWRSESLTYTFTDNNTNIPNSDSGLSNINLFNSEQRAAALAVLEHISNITDLTFSEVSSDAKISFRAADLDSGTAGFAYYPSLYYGTDVYIDNDYNSTDGGGYVSLSPGSFGYALLLHEIGHAMGLEHPHDGSDTLSSAEDNFNSTVMSYNDSTYSSVGGYIATAAGPTANQTYQIYDIAVLQELYGANSSYNSGDTTYSFDGSYDVRTLWDGAGSDLIDASSYTGDATIDLREGLENVTSIGNSYLWIAYNANIENATGGSGNDLITGNALANTIKGGSGTDTLIGNGGDDWFNGNAGNDSITGGNGNDTVRGGKDLDTLHGGDGDEFINGNNDNDLIYGDAGNDTIHGGKSDDQIIAGAGNDLIYGDLGNDTLTGGSGADIFIVKSNGENDVILDFVSGSDTIELNGTSLSTETLLSAVSFSSEGATIAISDGTSLLIYDLIESSFSLSDFSFT